MKKTVLTLGFLTLSLMATDFSSLTTEELIALRGTVTVEEQADFREEMKSRIATMTEEEQASFTASRQTSGNKGAGAATPPTFADIDTDGDGQITQEELDTARSDRQAKNIEEGKLLKNADNAPTLDSIDTNNDGVIDETEFQNNQLEQIEKHTEQMGNQGVKQQLQDNSAIGTMGKGKGVSGMRGANR